MKRITVLNGPNINLLGTREPDIYGHQTLEDIKMKLEAEAAAYSIQLDFYQSNHEGDIIDRIHDAYQKGYNGIIINPGHLPLQLCHPGCNKFSKYTHHRSSSFQYPCQRNLGPNQLLLLFA